MLYGLTNNKKKDRLSTETEPNNPTHFHCWKINDANVKDYKGIESKTDSALVFYFILLDVLVDKEEKSTADGECGWCSSVQ